VLAGPTARIGPYAVLGEGSQVGERNHPGVLEPLWGKPALSGTTAGSIPGSSFTMGRWWGTGSSSRRLRLGSDGFWVRQEGGVHLKVPQVDALCGEDVEIGANTTVDRARWKIRA